jgi:hypothetical protein
MGMMKGKWYWMALVWFGFISARSQPDSVKLLQEYCQAKYPHTDLNTFIYVGIQRQQLYLIENWKITDVFQVSTSRYGAGFEKDSHKTPWGLHCISQCVGKDVPYAGILKGIHFSGKIADIELNAVSTGKDEITSRALRLEGMEPGLNKGGKNDSYARDIYIHGTPEEGLIGTASSHGCVRMRNADIIKLFDKCRVRMPVLLLDN